VANTLKPETSIPTTTSIERKRAKEDVLKSNLGILETYMLCDDRAASAAADWKANLSKTGPLVEFKRSMSKS
jgi:hypothetical protein